MTGGEPTVRRDLVDIIQRLKSFNGLESVGITTNALVLTRMLVPLQRAGLDAINISLDTLKPAKYEKVVMDSCPFFLTNELFCFRSPDERDSSE